MERNIGQTADHYDVVREKKGSPVDLMNVIGMTALMTIAMSGCIFGTSCILANKGSVEIALAYATKSENAFTIFVEMKNGGGGASTIEDVFLNAVQYKSTQLPLTIGPGQEAVVQLSVAAADGIESGGMAHVWLHGTDGMSYSIEVVLP
jgi:hypothetical protein